jgi:hypothetical protein
MPALIFTLLHSYHEPTPSLGLAAAALQMLTGKDVSGAHGKHHERRRQIGRPGDMGPGPGKQTKAPAQAEGQQARQT